MNYKIIQAKQHHIPELTSIFYEMYKEAKHRNPLLPEIDMNNVLENQLEKWIDRNLCFIALSENTVVGYIVGIPVNEFFSSFHGTYIPLFGHGAIKLDRQRIYQTLYTYASEFWMKNNQLSHAITMFCDNQESVNTWMLLGFGTRCIDAIRSSKPIYDRPVEEVFHIIKASEEHIPDIAELSFQDSLHFTKAPAFMVRPKESMEDIIHNFKEWVSIDNHHLWIAYDQNQAVGYLRIEESGESFLSEHSDVMNITGAFTKEEYRGKGVSKQLLNHVLLWLTQHDYPLCVVDFESINVIGSNFWHKYFTPYTYSMHRLIDDRITKKQHSNTTNRTGVAYRYSEESMFAFGGLPICHPSPSKFSNHKLVNYPWFAQSAGYVT